MIHRVAFGRHFPEKSLRRSLRHFRSTIDSKIHRRRMLGCAALLRGGDRMMNPRRRAHDAWAFCGTVGLAGWFVASLAGPGSTRIEHASAAVPTAPVPVAAAPIEDSAASLAANASLADEPQAIAMGNAGVANTVVANAAVASAEVATAAEPAAGTATDTTAAW